MNKTSTWEQIKARLHDGMTVMIGGFFAVGTPLKAIDEIVESGVKDLTLISIANANPYGTFDMAKLFENKQIKKFITSHTGTCQTAIQQYKNGELDIEFYPMGSLIEKIRCGGAGLGGVLTPTGIGTLLEEGKQKITVQNKEYLLETPLRADIAFIKGYRADFMGNVQYRGTGNGSSTFIASASDYTVVEADEIASIGQIQPMDIGTPGIFIDAVLQGYDYTTHQKMISELWDTAGLLQ